MYSANLPNLWSQWVSSSFWGIHLFHLWVIIWIFTTWSLQPHNFSESSEARCSSVACQKPTQLRGLIDTATEAAQTKSLVAGSMETLKLFKLCGHVFCSTKPFKSVVKFLLGKTPWTWIKWCFLLWQYLNLTSLDPWKAPKKMTVWGIVWVEAFLIALKFWWHPVLDRRFREMSASGLAKFKCLTAWSFKMSRCVPLHRKSESTNILRMGFFLPLGYETKLDRQQKCHYPSVMTIDIHRFQ